MPWDGQDVEKKMDAIVQGKDKIELTGKRRLETLKENIHTVGEGHGKASSSLPLLPLLPRDPPPPPPTSLRHPRGEHAAHVMARSSTSQRGK